MPVDLGGERAARTVTMTAKDAMKAQMGAHTPRLRAPRGRGRQSVWLLPPQCTPVCTRAVSAPAC